ncbi:CLUMA_CG011162, isoform A [Clunio marinus]|uniref:non-specific serine/threonine protein kinase n=1 Tax=Clunio marinus TaxID=568069 RepID=A0A1J1IBX2_9DIPT|nr:CLUMA_CG011162, isoform A [Clunio marinus]
MSILSVLKLVKINAKYLLPFFLIVGIVIKSVSSNLYDSQVKNSQINNVGNLPYCDENIIKDRTASKTHLYVTTLDGRISSLDLTKAGTLQWSVPTEPGDLLSSSIHRLELTNNGKYVRMIPSLNGGIYKFDGESIEAIPMTADDLLKSSFKFSEDMVISGGKEVRLYGINTRTGNVIYECSMNDCKNRKNHSDVVEEDQESEGESQFNPLIDDILVVKRQTQTVRAIEPRTGLERWNFSIGHHELDLHSNENCRSQNNEGEQNQFIQDIDLRVIVPDGIICGYSKKNPNDILWRQKFDSPIVSIYRMNDNNQLYSVDLFKNIQWLWKGKDFIKPDIETMPSVYLGMYQQQLYIQESEAIAASYKSYQLSLEHNLIHEEQHFPKIPFKPLPASNTALVKFINTGEEENENKEDSRMTKKDEELYAQSLLYASQYSEGKGFFFFTEKDFNHSMQCHPTKPTRSTNINTDEPLPIFNQQGSLQIKQTSLWDYWREISVIALTTAFVINVMLNNRRNKIDTGVVYVAVPYAKDAIEFEEEQKQKKIENEILMHEIESKIRNASESSNPENVPYESRFLTDFDLVQCLGKGGFGVVFEAKNKLDDCRYAIKRILLPSKIESKDRVLREVKTLALCEHKNIVRYFHTWVEEPPKGWQELKDKELLSRDFLSTSITIDSPSPTEESKAFLSESLLKKNANDFSVQTGDGNLMLMNLQKHDEFTDFSKSDFTNFNKNTPNDDDSTSFIQFKADTNDSNKENEDDSNSADESFDIEFKEPSHESISVNNKKDVITIEVPNDESISQTNQMLSKSHRNDLSLNLQSLNALKIKKLNVNVAALPPRKIYLYILMQLCMKTSLKDWLRENDVTMRNGKTLEIWGQIIEAVHYVHLKGLIHRDLKPSNIFFALDGQIKIGDFGLVTDMAEIPFDPLTSSSSNSNSSTQISEFDLTSISQKKHTQRVGTSLYMSPEQAKGLPYNYKVDIFSLGLILFELLNFFHTESERYKVLENIRKNIYPTEFTQTFKAEFDLLKMMLSKNPVERPTTYGIAYRPPLNKTDGNENWHFELPTRRKESSTSLSTNK